MQKKHSRIGLLGSVIIHSILFTGIWYAVTRATPPKFEEQSTISMEIMAALLQQPEVATAPDINNEAIEEPTKEEAEIIAEQVEEIEPIPEKIETPEPLPTLPEVKPQEVKQPLEKPKETPKPKKPEQPKEKQKEKPKEKEKPVSKLKEKAKEPPKEKKAEKPKTTVKAVQKGSEVKQGIVAKADPNAVKSQKVQAGIVNGSAQTTNPIGNSNRDNAGNSNRTQNGQSASGNEIGAYKALLERTLQRQANNAYPQREKMMRKTGVVTLTISVSPSGQVFNVSVVNSSGHAGLDTAAVKAAERTKLNAAPPSGFPTSLTVPIKFSLQ